MTRSNGTHGHPLDRRVYPDEQRGEHGVGQYPSHQQSPYPPRGGGAPHRAPPERGYYDDNGAGPHEDQWAYPQQPLPPHHDGGGGYPDHNGAGGYNGAAGFNGAGGAAPAYHYPAQQPVYGEPPYRGQDTFDDRVDYPPEPEFGGGQDPNGYEPAFTQYDTGQGHGLAAAPAGYDDDPTRGLSQFRNRAPLEHARDEDAAYQNGSPFPELRGTHFDHDAVRQYVPNGNHAPNGHAGEFGLGGVAPGRGFEEPASPAAYGQWDNYQQQPAPLPNGNGYADAGYDPNGLAGYAPDNGALTPHEHAYPEDEYEDDYEEPRGGLGRKLLIGSALVGAIFAGGIIAFGYGVLFGGPSGANGEPPVVRANADPARVEPADPGGRQFPNTDSRLIKKMGSRAPEGAARATPGGNADDPSNNRVKVVTTMTFDRNGRMVVANTGGAGTPTQGNVAAAAPPAPSADTGLPPGTTVGTTDGFGPPPGTTVTPPPAPPPTNRAPPQPQTVAETRVPPAAAPSSPRRHGRFPPLPERAADARTSARTPPANVQRVQPRPQRVAVAAPARPAAPAAAANGYVAVLSTKRTRIDALKSYADLQQRYGSALNGAIPDVQKADLRSRGLGLMYRVVVGPPGSRQAALKLCGRLRSAGYKGCWVKAY